MHKSQIFWFENYRILIIIKQKLWVMIKYYIRLEDRVPKLNLSFRSFPILPGYFMIYSLFSQLIKVHQCFDDLSRLIPIQKMAMKLGRLIWINSLICSFIDVFLFFYSFFSSLKILNKIFHFSKLFGILPCAHTNIETFPFNKVIFSSIPNFLFYYFLNFKLLFRIPLKIRVIDFRDVSYHWPFSAYLSLLFNLLSTSLKLILLFTAHLFFIIAILSHQQQQTNKMPCMNLYLNGDRKSILKSQLNNSSSLSSFSVNAFFLFICFSNKFSFCLSFSTFFSTLYLYFILFINRSYYLTLIYSSSQILFTISLDLRPISQFRAQLTLPKHGFVGHPSLFNFISSQKSKFFCILSAQFWYYYYNYQSRWFIARDSLFFILGRLCYYFYLLLFF